MDKTKLISIPWTLSGSTLAMVMEGQPYTIESDHPNFPAVLSALRCKEWDVVPDLVNVGRAITKLADGRIQVTESEVFYMGQPIVNSLTERMLRMLREGAATLSPMCNFLENCMANPNKGAVDRIFTFLEKSKLPLTPDGCFLAYRGVNEDFTAKHKGMWDDEGVYHSDLSYDNSPGKICKMPRKECDEDSHSCCSRGLHFCSLPYLGPEGNWAGGTDNLIVVKINPRDVVAVPYSYNDTKGRCCRFEVLRVWQGADEIKDLSRDAWEKSLVAETEEVTSPAVRVMLNLARLEEGLDGFELKPVSSDAYDASDEGKPLGEADWEGEDAVEDMPEGLCASCSKPYCDECDGQSTTEEVWTIIEGASWDKDTKKALIADLYKAALKAGDNAFAFQEDEKHKTQGDIKVTPKGYVLEYTAATQRWAACYKISI